MGSSPTRTVLFFHLKKFDWNKNNRSQSKMGSVDRAWLAFRMLTFTKQNISKLSVNSLGYFFLREMLVLLTAKWIALAVIDFETYSISQEICTRFCCALLCCGYAIVHNEFTSSIYPYSSEVALLALGQSLDCHSASEVSLMDMGKSVNV